MLINIFCFFVLIHNCHNTQVFLLAKGIKMVHKRLKIRKIRTKCAVSPAFQSTILRTFLNWQNFFEKSLKKTINNSCGNGVSGAV